MAFGPVRFQIAIGNTSTQGVRAVEETLFLPRDLILLGVFPRIANRDNSC